MATVKTEKISKTRKEQENTYKGVAATLSKDPTMEKCICIIEHKLGMKGII